MTEQTLTPAESLQASISTLERLAETRREIAMLKAEIDRLKLMLEYKQPRLELAQTAIPYAILLNERTSTYSDLIQQVNQIVQLDIPENLDSYAILADLFELLFYLRKDFTTYPNTFNNILNIKDNLTELEISFQVNTDIVINDIVSFVRGREDIVSLDIVGLILYLFQWQRIDSAYQYLISEPISVLNITQRRTSLAILIRQSSDLLADLIEVSNTTFILDNNYLLRIEYIMAELYPSRVFWEPQGIDDSPPLELNDLYLFVIQEQQKRLRFIKDFHDLVNEIIPGMNAQLDHAYNEVLLAIAYTINP